MYLHSHSHYNFLYLHYSCSCFHSSCLNWEYFSSCLTPHYLNGNIIFWWRLAEGLFVYQSKTIFGSMSHSSHNWSYPIPPLLFSVIFWTRTKNYLALFYQPLHYFCCFFCCRWKFLITLFSGCFIQIILPPPITIPRSYIGLFTHNTLVPCWK